MTHVREFFIQWAQEMYCSFCKREPSPNHKLKHERELRGWSQAKLAEKIGASCATVYLCHYSQPLKSAISS